MPTFIHGKKIKVLINKAEYSSYFKEMSAANTMDTAETSTFGSDTKSYIQGMSGGTLSLSGMFDGSAGAVDAELSTSLGATSESVVTVATSGVFTRGSRVVTGPAWSSNYQVAGSIGDVVSVSAEFQGSGGFRPGTSLKDLTAESATTLHTAVDNTVASTNGAVVTLHATANDRNGVVDIVVQHSSDGVSYVTLATFTQIPASTTSAQHKIVAGGTTVNRHVRVSSTVAGTTGSITYTVALVRL